MRKIRQIKHNRLLLLLSVLTMLLIMTACSGRSDISGETQTAPTTAPETNNVLAESYTETVGAKEEAKNGEGKIFIAYFTVPLNDGVDTVARASRTKSDDGTYGNVRYLANLIQGYVGGELFFIDTAQEYPMDDMDEMLDFAYKEKADNARPELSTHIENLDDYDIIFIGYPNWNADLPMPMYTFFEEYDFSGKTIIPFVAHGGSRASDTVQTIAELEPDATVFDTPATVSWNEIDKADSIISEWVSTLPF